METNTEPLESATAEPTTAEPMKPQGSAWPFIVYVLALFLVDGLGSASMGNVRSDFPMLVFVCVVYGQLALAMVVGGLMGSNWLEGVFLASVAVLCGVGIFQAASGVEIELENMLFTALIPLTCLFGAFPLILFRWTVGWRLCPETIAISPRARLSIEDLILVPAALVAFWVMALVPLGSDPYDELWTSLFMAILPMMGVCVLFVLPCTYWAFRIRDSGFRWALCMGYPLILSIGALAVIAASGSRLPGEAIGRLLFGTLLTGGVFMVGLQLLYSGGYRLVSSKRATVTPGTPVAAEDIDALRDASPFDLEPVATATLGKVDPQASSRKRHRIAVAVLLIATAIVNTGTWTYGQMQQRRALVKIVSNGGKVEWVNGQPIKITFGPTTTENEIDQLPAMPTVTSLSVAGTNVTSFYIRNNFNSLTSLDIRRTNLRLDNLGLSPSIEIIVNEGQFTGSELQDFKLKGLVVKVVAD